MAEPGSSEPTPITPALALLIARFGRRARGPASPLRRAAARALRAITLPLRAVALALLRIYKKVVSPALPPACRFHPTCSVYAFQSVARHGLVRGGLLTAYRILRCQPFARPGYDPVPSLEEDPKTM